MNLVELFSGIGSQAKALKNLGVTVNTIGTCEWDVHAIAAYDFIHNDSYEIPEEIEVMSKEEILERLRTHSFSNSGKAPLEYSSLATYSEKSLKRIYTSVIRNKNFVDINEVDGNSLSENIDILTYSFPCQDLSNVGAFHGYNKGIDKDSGSRSSLLWQVGRILTEMKAAGKKLPRYLLMENVPALLSKRHFGNFTTWINDLKELGYISKYYQLNSTSFGLPQNRPRLLMISVYVGNNDDMKQLVEEYFCQKSEEMVIADYRNSAFYHEYHVEDLLRLNYGNRKIWEEAVECTPNDTVSRRKIWEDNPQIILSDGTFNPAVEFVRTITTKQDRNPNSGNLYFDCGIEGRGKFRYLTPRECLLFMGFTDEDFKRLKKENIEFHKGDAFFSRDKVIRMAGNSIPVKLLEGVFLQIMQIDSMLSEFRKRTFEIAPDINERKRYAKRITKFLFPRGIRCRAAGKKYPTAPDVLFTGYNSALFILDCLQHSHGCAGSVLPETNQSVWKKRIEHIAEEDNVQYSTLQSAGWQVLKVWKCELTPDKMEATLKRLETQIRLNGKKRI